MAHKYCIYCGGSFNSGTFVCSKCGKESKPFVDINSLPYEPLPADVASQMESIYNNTDNNVRAYWSKKRIFQAIDLIRAGKIKIAKAYIDAMPEGGTDRDYIANYVSRLTLIQLRNMNGNPISQDIEMYIDTRKENGDNPFAVGKPITVIQTEYKQGKFSYIVNKTDDFAQYFIERQGVCDATDNVHPRKLPSRIKSLFKFGC